MKTQAKDSLPALAAGPAQPNDQLPRLTRPPGRLEAQILELASTLQPGSHYPIKLGEVTRNNFDGKLYKMRAKGVLTYDFGVNKTANGGFALVRYTAPRNGRHARRA